MLPLQVGILLMSGMVPQNSPLANLKMLRAFRVFRLFKRIKSLNKIIVALGRALPGVTNAFLVMLLVMCIYAILGVEFFGVYGVEGTYLTISHEDGTTEDVDALTTPILGRKKILVRL